MLAALPSMGTSADSLAEHTRSPSTCLAERRHDMVEHRHSVASTSCKVHMLSESADDAPGRLWAVACLEVSKEREDAAAVRADVGVMTSW